MAVDLTIVVPTRNRRASVVEALETLRVQTAAPESYEIVVVVDGATDGTGAALRTLLGRPEWTGRNVRILEREWQGAAAARNAGLHEATGRWVLFVDDDTQASADLVAAHVNCQLRAGPDGQVVLGKVAQTDRPGAFYAEFNAWWERHYERLARSPRMWDSFFTGNVSVPREAALRVGGFDANIAYGEDIEFGYRLHADGVRFDYAPDALVTTVNTKSPADLLRDILRRGEGAVRIYRLAPDTFDGTGLAEFGAVGLRVRLVRRVLLGLWRVPLLGGLLERLSTAWAGSGLTGGRRRITRIVETVFYWRGVRSTATRTEWSQFANPGVAVLLYHSITDDSEGDRFTVTSRRFARQMRVLRLTRRRVVSLDDAVESWRSGRALPRRAVAITFDDGYRNNRTEAWPVLQRFGYPATLFFVTGLAGGRNEWDIVRGRKPQPLLTWDEVRELDAAGFRAHAHTTSHADLTCADPASVESDVHESLHRLEAELGHPARLFAYPYSARNQTVMDHVRAAGFTTAFSVRPGFNTAVSNPWDRPRIEVRGTDGVLRFAVKVLLGDDPLRRLPRWLPGFVHGEP